MILVTGGAGYIGSHVVNELIGKNFRVTVMDNLSTGHRAAVPPAAEFIEADLLDEMMTREILLKVRPQAVIHFAAKSIVSDSVANPLATFNTNVVGTLNLLKAMQLTGTRLLVFSSTAAVYGEPHETPIEEGHPLNPTNPYGESKYFIEKILARVAETGSLGYISLRYFNAAGADPEENIGEDHSPETHLVPLVLAVALGKKDKVVIFGDDYPTRDGTPIRDYIHIKDLSSAHILSLRALLENRITRAVYNLGNERGYSVKEVIDMAKKVTGKNISYQVGSRRKGDPSVLVASSRKIKKDLGWTPLFSDLSTIIDTAWRWHKNNPEGFRD